MSFFVDVEARERRAIALQNRGVDFFNNQRPWRAYWCFRRASRKSVERGANIGDFYRCAAAAEHYDGRRRAQVYRASITFYERTARYLDERDVFDQLRSDYRALADLTERRAQRPAYLERAAFYGARADACPLRPPLTLPRSG